MRPSATCRVVDSDGYVSLVETDSVDRLVGATGLADVLRSFWGGGSPSGDCPCCGWTLEEYRSTGLLGCGLCYSTVYPVVDK